MEAKIITVDYARKKLGEKGKRLTDREIEGLLVTLRLLCNKVIDSVVECKL
jgi:hypothetical protein